MYKRIFISCLFIFSLCQCQKNYQDENKITDERVGNIIIGASKSDVLSKLEMYKLENLGGSVQTYYKVKVGAYKDKMDLEAFLRELKSDFPRAIPVRDKINKNELIN